MNMKLYPADWPVRLATGVGAGAGMGLAMLVGAVADHFGYWPAGLWGMIWGMIGVGVGVGVGAVLGQFVGRQLFRPRD
jgi:hypothetical protein